MSPFKAYLIKEVDGKTPVSYTHLDVYKRQVRECDLRSVGCVREHGFSVEHLADGQPIQAADQFVIYPDCDGVGIATLN